MNKPDKLAKPERVSNDTEQPTRLRRISKPVSVLLNFIIAGMILTGLYLILQPYYLHWQQDRTTAELMKALEEGDGTIVINQDDLMVPGEEEEFIEQIENWDELDPTDTTPTDQTTAVSPTKPTLQPDPSTPTGPTTEGPAPTTNGTTARPTPKPTPKPVVIKAIGTIFIDKINLTMPIADRAESAQLRVAIGLLGGSAMPGTPGNTILLGHRMYTYGRHFNRLNEVVEGDKIVITTKERKLTYVVERQAIILPSVLRSTLSKYTEEKQLILVTCHPVRIASHRLLVYAKLVSDTPI